MAPQDPVEINPNSSLGIATAFAEKTTAAFQQKDAAALQSLFHTDGWWRDILTVDLDMNSIKTPDIPKFLERFGFPKIQKIEVDKPKDCAYDANSKWILAYLKFETDVARGRGLFRITESAEGKNDWKIFTFFTALWEIKDHEEFVDFKRPLGTLHGQHLHRKNWKELREDRDKFENKEPTVVIVGGGQNGLMLAARLNVLGIDALLIEKNPRVGDSWRNRYHTLALHDPIWADYFAYLSYPPSWPIYTPKDKIADWMEHYADIMELPIWLNSTIERNPVWDANSRTWSVKVVKSDGSTGRTLKPTYLVLASGFSGEPRMPTFDYSEFKGLVTHSSGYKGARNQGYEGKKAVVVGCCNSGHDIAADLYENGADVTIVQRSHTYVMTSENGVPGLLGGVYSQDGPSTEDADLVLTSLPLELLASYHRGATVEIAKKDKKILDGLEAVGFKLNKYPDGLFMKYFRDGGGYYIDVGCSKLIADKKIKLKQGKQITKLTKTGVLFEDGVEVPADIVVFATGYSSMRETVRRVISDDVADKLGPVWGADAQGEIPGVWRNSGVENFYLQCGNMFQARCFSKHLALQIQIDLLKLGKSVYPKYKEVIDPRF